MTPTKVYAEIHTLDVPLNHGKVALIDEEDGNLVLASRWRVQFAEHGLYAVKSGGTDDGIRMHRVILGANPGQLVDHKNGDGLDNRRANLRICDSIENARNRRLTVANKSGFLGVSRHSKNNRWTVRIQVARRSIHVGNFLTAEEAALAYDEGPVRISAILRVSTFPAKVSSRFGD